MDYILLIVGFYILIQGADYLVNGASSFAKKIGISPLVIGLTIVAFGTSAPELFVNSFSALKGETDIAIGNVVGSNIINILLILGIATVIYPVTAKNSTIYKEIPFALLGSFVLLVLLFDTSFGFGEKNILAFGDGVILLLFFILFLLYTHGISKKGLEVDNVDVIDISKPKSIVYMVGGITGLALGSDFLVKSAINIAESLGVSDTFIGLTIVAIGTSLPELMTSAVASMKKNSDIAIGNVVGSNIFNTFLILGIISLITPIEVENSVMIDVIVMILVTFSLMISMLFIGKKGVIYKWNGVVFILSYIAYTGYLISTQAL